MPLMADRFLRTHECQEEGRVEGEQGASGGVEGRGAEAEP